MKCVSPLNQDIYYHKHYIFLTLSIRVAQCTILGNGTKNRVYLYLLYYLYINISAVKISALT